MSVDPVVLFINRCDSRCGACGKQTLPGDLAHDRVSGYGGGQPGCGVVWTHVSSDYSGSDMLAGAAAMRPDLTPLDQREAMRFDRRCRQEGTS